MHTCVLILESQKYHTKRHRNGLDWFLTLQYLFTFYTVHTTHLVYALEASAKNLYMSVLRRSARVL